MKKFSRRKFIKTGTGIATSIAFGNSTFPMYSKNTIKKTSSKMIGMSIGAPSFVDEGIEGCLDTLQKRANVNTLFTYVYSYKDGLSGRSWPPPDHGRQTNSPKFHGGYYAKVNSKYYEDTIFKDNPQVLRAPDEGDFDLLGSVIPAAKKRGIKTIAWLADQIHNAIPQFHEMTEVDISGQKLNQVCLNNPNFKAFLSAMVKDCVNSYDIDGLLWRSERWGALTNLLYQWDGKGKTTMPCFCQFCKDKSQKRGINFARVKEGFIELQKYVVNARSGIRPAEGYYAIFWRILMKYPEILAWEMFWNDSLRDTLKSVYTLAKSIKPGIKVGSSIPHSVSFNPFHRATIDMQEFSKYNDFMKIILYNMEAGPRAVKYIDDLYGTYLQDLSREDRLTFLNKVMGYNEGGISKIEKYGMSSDYVYNETVSWLKAAQNTNMKIYTGIDIDVSPHNDNLQRTREGVKNAVLAALRAGAPGILLSRMYSEMMLDHLSGVGDAINEFNE